MSQTQKRPARARSGLRPAPRPSAHAPNPRVPGEERSKQHSKSRDARTGHDKDGNKEAQHALGPTRRGGT
jgi:hypothetical protein